MRRKQEELINYLYTHNEKVTANILSKALNLSIRTIKSYIAELNMNYPSLISSSNREIGRASCRERVSSPV